MFAGLPGIGVGTLFYVLTALWMPVRESVRVLRGESSWQRWRLIGVQLFFSMSIIASIAIADRLLLRLLGQYVPGSVDPAHLINHSFSIMSPKTLLAAPIMASVLLLAAVLLLVEVLRWGHRLIVWRRERTRLATRGSASRRLISESPLVGSAASPLVPEEPAA